MKSKIAQSIKKTRVSGILRSGALSAMPASAGPLLAHAEQIRSYRSFLVDARKRKAAAGAVSAPLEAAVLSRARAARDAGRHLTGGALALLQQLRTTDLVPEVMKAIDEHGEVDAATELRRINDMPAIHEALNRAGISPGLLADSVGLIEQSQAKLTADKQQRSTVTFRGGHKVTLSHLDVQLPRAPLASLQTKPSQLLQQSFFDETVAAFAQGGLPGAVPMTRRPTDSPKELQVSLYDAYALASLATLTELERHVRKLECSGSLDTYSGEQDPFAWVIGLFIAALVVFLVGWTLGMIGGATGDETLEDAGLVLIGISLFILGAAVSVLVGMFDPGWAIVAGVGLTGLGIGVISSVI